MNDKTPKEDSIRGSRFSLFLFAAVALATVLIFLNFSFNATNEGGELSGASEQAGIDERFVIALGDDTLVVDESRWEVAFPISSRDFDYEYEFKAKTKRHNETYERRVTVYAVEMTAGRKIGNRMLDNVYVEAYPAHPGVTFVLRVDKDSYWLYSRQSFNPSGFGGYEVRPDEIENDSIGYDRLISLPGMQGYVDEALYILNTEFSI